MRHHQENPDSEEMRAASRQYERDVFAAKMSVAQQGEEIPCPNCYGGHFRPCQWCGDTGRVTPIPTEEKE